ncbi:MAG: hypothetical protein ACOCQS_00800 [Bacillota bacterium]
MRKLLVLSLGIIMVFGVTVMVGATEVNFEWGGSGYISTDMANDVSNFEFGGEAESFQGNLSANDMSYGRVEVKQATAVFGGEGIYGFSQNNVLQNGADSNLNFGVQSDEFGFVNFKTDAWRNGNSLKTNGYGGQEWSWSGTNEQFAGATGQYAINYGASYSENSSYNAFVVGEGFAGVGTWKAGSNAILNAGGPIGGEILGIAGGTGSFIQDIKNIGSMETQFNFGSYSDDQE